MDTPVTPALIIAAKNRGWAGAASLLLTVLEPIAPLGAQVLWVAQPALGLFLEQDALGELAEALEEPGGVERMRRLLEDGDDTP